MAEYKEMKKQHSEMVKLLGTLGNGELGKELDSMFDEDNVYRDILEASMDRMKNKTKSNPIKDKEEKENG